MTISMCRLLPTVPISENGESKLTADLPNVFRRRGIGSHPVIHGWLPLIA